MDVDDWNLKNLFEQGRPVSAPADYVTIRPIELTDAESICEAIVETEVDLSRWWSPNAVARATLQDERERITERIRSRSTGTAFSFVVIDLRDGCLLGRCGINHIAQEPAFANVGYWIRTSRRGQGIAPAAVRQVARFGFENVGLVRLELVIDVDNAASIRVAEKVGAILEGVLRNRVIGQGMAARPACMYSLVPEDLAKA